jgi:phosphotransferase system IIB component
MQSKYFSPSINILRDKDNGLFYIPTRNGEKVFQKIASSFSSGTKSFNIIGAYGSGKSAFILALEKVLNRNANYFSNLFDTSLDKVESTFIIGEYSSFKQVFCETFGFDDSKELFKNIRKDILNNKESNVGYLWVVDEFGKFLEYAAKESPEEELYFIQQLAEFVNSPDLPIIFITTLHQAFEDYSLELSKAQRNEWDKVKGRLVEVSFNEPVEQLLFLASERIVEKSFPCSISKKMQQELFSAIQEADVFPMKDYFSFEFAQKLFPFDILSASIAIVAFQRYGQNERSLFSLLESEDYLGINDFNDGKEFYNVVHIYDYLKYNFHSLLNSRYNQDAANWKALDEAIQRAESIFEKNYEGAANILKTIGLSSILGRQGQKITKEFLEKYANIALGIKDTSSIIEMLENKQVIRYRNYSQRYVLFKGTDFDLNFELELAENQVSKDLLVVQQLKKYFDFPIIPAKRAFLERGTPRYFVYELSENPIKTIAEGQIDGYINLVFNDLLKADAFIAHSSKINEAILYGWAQNTDEIKKLVAEIEKVKIVKSKCLDDPIAIAELDAYLNASKEKLNDSFFASFYGKGANIRWFYNGKELRFINSKDLNQCLTKISYEIYSETPVLRNELMNREKVSGTISSAKNKLIQQILSSSNEENLGFDENRFPPEKTIYWALLRNTGIHKQSTNNWVLGKPTDKSFFELWNASVNFLNDCAIASRKLTDFIDILKGKPFKLKQGFIDFWVPIFLIAKQKHFAFYEQGIFIPDLTADTLEVAMKQPQKYQISTFSLDENKLKIFNRYRYFLNLIEENAPNSDTFIETIKPFLVFYNRLNTYTKQTRKLSKEAIRLRDAISSAIDPEKVFFEDMPRALGFTINDLNNNQSLENFSVKLQSSTRELSSAFSNLINRIEEIIGKTARNEQISFPENKLLLQQRFKKLKKEQLDPKLKVLIQRINTPLDDRQSWISSIATAIIGKSLEQFTDDDEQAFHSLFPRRIHDLDNLTDISKKDIDEAKEEILKLELTTFVKGVQRNLIRLPKSKTKLIEEKKTEIQKMLDSQDKQANIALLIKLLQEEIGNE